MMKKLLSGVLAVGLFFAMSATALAGNFTDMPNNYATEALTAAVKNGLLTGDNGKLMPEDSLTRAQMAAIMNRAFGASDQGEIKSFTDVKADAWYYADMAKAVKMGTFKGAGNNQLNPNGFVTRQEVFVVIARALGLNNGKPASLNKFTDQKQVAPWAVNATAALIEAGYVSGADNLLNPTANISRADFAVIMNNIIKNYINKAGTVTANTGSVMINVPNVTLDSVTVKGDLIIGDGVGNGDVTLKNVNVSGRVIIRGGGQHSIKIEGGNYSQDIVIMKTADGGIRVTATNIDSKISVIVGECKAGEKVIVDGNIGQLAVVGADIQLKIPQTAAIEQINVVAANATINVAGTVKTVLTSGAAKNATITAASTAKIDAITSNSDNLKVLGDGKITTVVVEKGADVIVNTPETSVSAGSEAGKVTAGGSNVVAGGGNVTTPPIGGGDGDSTITTNALIGITTDINGVKINNANNVWLINVTGCTYSGKNTVTVDTTYGGGLMMPGFNFTLEAKKAITVEELYNAIVAQINSPSLIPVGGATQANIEQLFATAAGMDDKLLAAKGVVMSEGGKSATIKITLSNGTATNGVTNISLTLKIK